MTKVIDTPKGIEAFAMLSVLGRLRIEMAGIRFKPIPGHGSTFSYVKNTYGFKGNKEKVFALYESMLKEKGIIK